MSDRLKALREKRAKLVHDARELIDAIDDNTKQEDADEAHRKADAMLDESDKVAADIEREERTQAAEAQLAERVERQSGKEDRTGEGGREERTADVTDEGAFRSFVQYGMNGLSPEQRQLVAALRTDISPEMRAQAAGTDSAGGYTVPEGFLPEITKTMAAWGPMLDPGVTRVLNTATGNDLPWPTMDDTGNVGALLAENTQDGEQDITFASKTLNAYTYTSKIIRVSFQLLQDSAFDMEQEVIRPAFGERIGRIANTHLTTGTGSSQPNGIVTAAGAGITAASATAIASDEIIDLEHSVDPAYRTAPTCRYMFNDTTFKAVRKLKDGQGNYLWQLGDIRSGAPATLNNYPYSINQAMASPATTTVPMVFGDFNKYIVRRVRDFTMLRLTERYADFLQVGFIAFNRIDGELADAAAVKKLTMA